MKASAFRIVYLFTTVWAAIAIAIYLFQLLAHRQPFPSVPHTLALLALLTAPRLLCLNTFLHRGLAHGAFRPTAAALQHVFDALSSLSLLPYSPRTWAQRHQHYHTRHPHIHHLPSDKVSPAVLSGGSEQGAAAVATTAEDAQSVAARIIAPVDYRPSTWRFVALSHALWRYEDLWQPVPTDDKLTSSGGGSVGKSAAQYSHVLVAAAFNVLACVVLLRAHSHLRLALALYYVPSLLAVSQLYLWLASAALLNHSVAFPLLGYQRFANPHHNSLLLSLLTAGGGYLNNHHAAPANPTHASLPYELDPPGLLIRLLAAARLVALPAAAASAAAAPLAFPASAVLSGRVSHTRMWPFYHRFESDVTFVRLELNALTPLALDAYPLYSSRGRRWYLGVGVAPQRYLSAEQVVRLCVAEGVAAERLGGKAAGVRVVLVTCPSYLGYAMNPISYYLVYAVPAAAAAAGAAASVARNVDVDAELGELVAMVSEVHNTPWGQRCHYVHDAAKRADANSGGSNGGGGGGGEEAGCEGWLYDTKEKKMHVSPFMSMHYTYTLHYTPPTLARWEVRWTMQHTPHPNPAPPATMALSSTHPIQPAGAGQTDVERRHFKAVLVVQGRRLTQSAAVWNAVRYPLQSFRVVWGIYWQAAVLFVRKHAVFYSHPDPSTRLWK